MVRCTPPLSRGRSPWGRTRRTTCNREKILGGRLRASGGQGVSPSLPPPFTLIADERVSFRRGCSTLILVTLVIRCVTCPLRSRGACAGCGGAGAACGRGCGRRVTSDRDSGAAGVAARGAALMEYQKSKPLCLLLTAMYSMVVIATATLVYFVEFTDILWGRILGKA